MLDEDARRALIAVPPDILGSSAEAWFTLLSDTATDEDGRPRGWDDFTSALKGSPDASSFSQAVDVFVDTMARHSSAWPGIAESLAKESTSDLVSAYRDAHTEPAADEADQGELWTALLAEGGDWSAWDGDDEGWAQWRDWFHEVAAGHGAAASALAREQLGWMDDAASVERVAGLVALGFTVGGAEEGADGDAGEAEREPGEVWADVVAEGGDWSAWDGDDEGWEQWRDWFYQVAATQDEVNGEALARQQIGWLDDKTLAERVAGLQQQGITVTGAQEALAGRQQQAHAAVEELVETNIDDVINDALAALNVDQGLAEQIKPLVHERLRETATSRPELFAGLDPEGLANLRAQLQQELQTELSNAMQPAG